MEKRTLGRTGLDRLDDHTKGLAKQAGRMDISLQHQTLHDLAG